MSRGLKIRKRWNRVVIPNKVHVNNNMNQTNEKNKNSLKSNSDAPKNNHVIRRRKRFDRFKLIDINMGFPHKSYPIIQVTGTDGKGSTSSMLSSILTESGYNVGLFTSPPISKRNDMIKINGIIIPDSEYNAIKNEIIEIKQSIFGKVESESLKLPYGSLDAMTAFIYFKRQKVDIAVIEGTTGIGTCPTGICQPILSLLTNITNEQVSIFGGDILELAKDKAEIIKPFTPIIVSETPSNEDIKNIILKKAHDCKSPLLFTDEKVNNLIIKRHGMGAYETVLGEVSMSLGGDYQEKNLNLVLNAVLELRKQGFLIPDFGIINGLKNIQQNTGLMGRFQILRTTPLVILDACHTIAAWEKVIPQLMNLKYNHLHIIYQVCKDKPIDEIIKLFPDSKKITYHFPKYKKNRFATPEFLEGKFKHLCLSKCHKRGYLSSFLEKLIRKAKKNDVIFIGGSCYSIKHVNEILESNK